MLTALDLEHVREEQVDEHVLLRGRQRLLEGPVLAPLVAERGEDRHAAVHRVDELDLIDRRAVREVEAVTRDRVGSLDECDGILERLSVPAGDT